MSDNLGGTGSPRRGSDTRIVLSRNSQARSRKAASAAQRSPSRTPNRIVMDESQLAPASTATGFDGRSERLCTRAPSQSRIGYVGGAPQLARWRALLHG